MALHLLDLPEEALGEVLSYLNRSDRFLAFALVSHRLNYLAYALPLRALYFSAFSTINSADDDHEDEEQWSAESGKQKRSLAKIVAQLYSHPDVVDDQVPLPFSSFLPPALSTRSTS